jgi:cysteinylglycine-S-conjugate dipeptidase
MHHEPSHEFSVLEERVHDLMPALTAELSELIAIPSVSETGYPESTHEDILRARDYITDILRDAGCERITELEIADTAPVIIGEVPAPDGAPTVLLYSHYDVVPAGDESLWDTPPFEATPRGDALHGRGAGDTKSNIIAVIGALRVWDGRPPVGLKFVFEGQEEVGSGGFVPYALEHPELFDADAMVIADMGSVRPGVPTLTVALRGMANVTVEARTLGSAKHSGQYGGAAPDALLALIRALSTLHDEHGNVAVDGLRREEWTGTDSSEAEFRDLAEVLEGQPLVGTGSLGSRVWSGPAITVIGIDAPTVDGALNAVQPYARAKLNLRVHPQQDAVEAQAALARHLEKAMPFGITLSVELGPTGNGFAADTTSPVFAAACASWSDAWGAETITAGGGGSIPIVSALAQASPRAVVMLGGATDGFANIHGPNERVLLDEFEKTTLAVADFLGRFADSMAEGSSR